MFSTDEGGTNNSSGVNAESKWMRRVNDTEEEEEAAEAMLKSLSIILGPHSHASIANFLIFCVETLVLICSSLAFF